MRSQAQKQSWWMPARASLRDERGAAMVEYAPLLALIALAVLVSLSLFGPWVSDQLSVGGLSIGYGDYVAGECPTDWGMAHIDSPRSEGEEEQPEREPERRQLRLHQEPLRRRCRKHRQQRKRKRQHLRPRRQRLADPHPRHPLMEQWRRAVRPPVDRSRSGHCEWFGDAR